MTTTAQTRLATRRATLHLTRDYDWRDDASCREVDPELFFPIGTTRYAQIQTEQAKAVCAGCPSRQECLEWALATGQYTGVWGGLSEEERRPLHADGSTGFLRCLERQEYIEERQANGAGMRELADELRVSYSVMRRAVGYFAEERAGAAGEEVKAA